MTKWTVQRVPKSVIEKELEFNRDNLINTFDRFFDEAFRGQFPDLYKGFGIDPFSKASYPKVNVLSFDDKVEIEAEIAGFQKEDISIQIEDDVLSIVGKTTQQAEQTDKSVYLLAYLQLQTQHCEVILRNCYQLTTFCIFLVKIVLTYFQMFA